MCRLPHWITETFVMRLMRGKFYHLRSSSALSNHRCSGINFIPVFFSLWDIERKKRMNNYASTQAPRMRLPDLHRTTCNTVYHSATSAPPATQWTTCNTVNHLQHSEPPATQWTTCNTVHHMQHSAPHATQCTTCNTVHHL